MAKLVFICDDDDGILDVASMLLRDKGYHVKTRMTGVGMVEHVKKAKPDLILLDLWLPGIDGEKLTRNLKSDPETNGIPIVIMSAHRDTKIRAQKAGADGYITKPFDISVFEKTIEKYSP